MMLFKIADELSKNLSSPSVLNMSFWPVAAVTMVISYELSLTRPSNLHFPREVWPRTDKVSKKTDAREWKKLRSQADDDKNISRCDESACVETNAN